VAEIDYFDLVPRVDEMQAAIRSQIPSSQLGTWQGNNRELQIEWRFVLSSTL
jgi:hypothetical protein